MTAVKQHLDDHIGAELETSRVYLRADEAAPPLALRCSGAVSPGGDLEKHAADSRSMSLLYLCMFVLYVFVLFDSRSAIPQDEESQVERMWGLPAVRGKITSLKQE